MSRTTDTQRDFFRKSQTFGLGQTNWAENFWGIWECNFSDKQNLRQLGRRPKISKIDLILISVKDLERNSVEKRVHIF